MQKWVEFFMISVLVNEPCPKFPSDMGSPCVEECGEYGYKECEETEICCSGTGTCGSACLPGN